MLNLSVIEKRVIENHCHCLMSGQNTWCHRYRCILSLHPIDSNEQANSKKRCVKASVKLSNSESLVADYRTVPFHPPLLSQSHPAERQQVYTNSKQASHSLHVVAHVVEQHTVHPLLSFLVLEIPKSPLPNRCLRSCCK